LSFIVCLLFLVCFFYSVFSLLIFVFVLVVQYRYSMILV
jgi:hypothetical protein